MKEIYSVYRLSSDEVERFDTTFGRDLCMETILADAAAYWREHLLPAHKSRGDCRWTYLRLIIVRNGSPIPAQARMEELPSLARYLCMRVEKYVEELDHTANSKKVP